jgi:hypothetical protein
MSFFVNKSRCLTLLALSLAASPAAFSQVNVGDAPQTPDMPPMNMPAMKMPGMNMTDMNAAGKFLMNLASGTSANPAAWPMPMVVAHLGNWNTMFMANAFLADIQQSGPRGGDKLYSTNLFMASAEHSVGSNGAFEAVLMLSLEPATITDRRYPLLFQTGETAYGLPLADAQHPHNFVMALGFHYAYSLNEDTILDLYFAPVGDPAIGPVAYPHRASATELPEAPLSHHLQDSTHIAYDVATVGVSHGEFKLEASGFHGAEPGENRWTIDQGAIDSWSARLWFFPSKRWAAQFSGGHLTHPEALEPGNQTRLTASVAYTRPMKGSSSSSTLIWGRTHSTATFRNLNSYLAESEIPFTKKNFFTTRLELVDKDELFNDTPLLYQSLDAAYGSTFRIGAYTFGYTRDIDLFKLLETGVGANFTAYSLPDAIKPEYGNHPVGGNVFIRVRLKARK